MPCHDVLLAHRGRSPYRVEPPPTGLEHRLGASAQERADWRRAGNPHGLGPEVGVQFGYAWEFEDGTLVKRAIGFNGNFEITHWAPAMAAPLIGGSNS